MNVSVHVHVRIGFMYSYTVELFGRVVVLHVDARVDGQRQLGAPQLRALLRQRALHALHTPLHSMHSALSDCLHAAPRAITSIIILYSKKYFE